MSHKLKSIDDCVTGRDYLEYAQAHDWEVTKVGSYLEIINPANGNVVHLPDTARTLPKQTRGLINTALVKAGLIAAILVAVAWVVL